MKIHLRKYLVFVVFSFLTVSIAQASLTEELNSILGRSSQKNVKYSVCVINAETGRTVYEHNAHNALIPASNMKVITSAAALRYLGSDFEYKTKIGIQDGDLVILGSGDPMFGDKINDAKYSREPDWILKDILDALKKNKVSSIKNIIVYTGIYDNQLVHPNWSRDELNRDFSAEVCGLNYNDNCISIRLENQNGIVKIFTEPDTSFVTLDNQVKIDRDKDGSFAAYRTNQPNKLKITGICNNKVGPSDVAIEKPAAFFGFVLAEYLIKNEIKITGQFIEKASIDTEGFKQITEFVTPISDPLARCNKDSLNFAAESFMKTIAAYNNPENKNGSWARGSELMGDFIKELGIDDTEFSIDDGSGLSRENLLSSNVLAKVLLDVYKGSNWEVYRDSMAIGGVDGTKFIAENFDDDKYLGKILAKSGTMTGIKSLTGICLTPGGDYIFSIITNRSNWDSQVAIIDIVETVFDEGSKI